jgi:hypothetical protein
MALVWSSVRQPSSATTCRCCRCVDLCAWDRGRGHFCMACPALCAGFGQNGTLGGTGKDRTDGCFRPSLTVTVLFVLTLIYCTAVPANHIPLCRTGHWVVQARITGTATPRSAVMAVSDLP